MATNVKVDGINHDMVYLNSFLKFGYTPTYNILDYLNRINSNFFTETLRFQSDLCCDILHFSKDQVCNSI
jgi:hypothetical protein